MSKTKTPWYWQYKDLAPMDNKETARYQRKSKAFTSGRVKCSMIGEIAYYHCINPSCPRSFYTVQDAIACCSGERLNNRYRK